MTVSAKRTAEQFDLDCSHVATRPVRFVARNAAVESIREQWWQQRSVARRQQIIEAQEQQRDAWFDQANEYYRSEKWRNKSAKVIERDGTCQACLKLPATEAHHLTYDHWMNEPLFDLVGVCHLCHEVITCMDRKRRGHL